MSVKSFKQKIKLIGKLSQGVKGGCWNKEHVPGSQILVMTIINKTEWKPKNKQTNKYTVCRFCLERRLFFFGLALCPHVSGRNGYQKRIFSKALSSVGMFDRLAVLVWKDKTQVFENDYVTELDTGKCACFHQRWYRLQLHVDGDFLENGQKISTFKQNQIRVVWALEHWHKNFLTNEMIFIFWIEYRKIPKISAGAHILQTSFLRGSFLEGLICGGKRAFQNRLSLYL